MGKNSPEVQACKTKTLFDDSIREAYEQRSRSRYEDRRIALAQAAEDRKAEWWAWYNRYLKTPEWRAKREKVLARAGWICEGCEARKATQVHHLSYDHAGDELLFELVAICDECHRRIHPHMEAAA